MEKDNKYQRFKKKQEEKQKKLNKAVDLSSLNFFEKLLLYKTSMEKVLDNPCHLQFEIHPGNGSSLAFSGNKAQMIFAVATILTQEEKMDFYENLSSVIAAAMILQEGCLEEKTIIRPESLEELKVYEEMIKKTPEEFEKIKSQIDK